MGHARLLRAPGSLHQDGWQGDRWDLHKGTSLQHWAGDRESHLPVLGRAGDQSCPLPACRTHVPGSVGLRAGFPGSPKAGIGEVATFYCNSLMGAVSTASLLSPTAGVAAVSHGQHCCGPGWRVAPVSGSSEFPVRYWSPPKHPPKRTKIVLTMNIAKLFS